MIRLVRVIVCPAPKDTPEVDISVSGTQLSPAVMRSGIGCVQSFVLQSKFVPNDLLTVECLEELKTFLPVGHQFLSRHEFDPFVGVSRHASADIYANLFRCYNAYYSGQVEEWRARMSSGSGGRITNAASTSKAVPSGVVSGVGASSSITSSQSKRASRKSQRQEKSC